MLRSGGYYGCTLLQLAERDHHPLELLQTAAIGDTNAYRLASRRRKRPVGVVELTRRTLRVAPARQTERGVHRSEGVGRVNPRVVQLPRRENREHRWGHLPLLHLRPVNPLEKRVLPDRLRVLWPVAEPPLWILLQQLLQQIDELCRPV